MGKYDHNKIQTISEHESLRKHLKDFEIIYEAYFLSYDLVNDAIEE